jgi:glycosyltransferase involved in cell wall biosynthesis
MTLSAVDACFRRFDGILIVNPGNGLQCGILRIGTRARLALNTDGVEWARGKWGPVARWYYRFAAVWGSRFVHTPVADSRGMQELYRAQFGVRSTFIPYAEEAYDSDDADRIGALDLEPRRYSLIVGRLIPENHTDTLVEGYQRAGVESPLVVVGGSNYRSSFHERLTALAGNRIRFLGHVNDRRLMRQLFRHARLYLHGHSVGGTNPALLQALASSSLIAANDVIFNREVAGDAATYFRASCDDVARVTQELAALPPDRERALRARARERLHEGGYEWKRVTDAYERALVGVGGSGSAGAPGQHDGREGA